MQRYLHVQGIAVLALASAGLVNAGCRLPVPDGGDERPSPENLSGQISKITGNLVLVRQNKTGRQVRVHLPSNPEIYTAFGGDASVSDLTPGQTAKVWFKACTWPKAGEPESAYFQIYSKDPNDRP